MTSFDTYKKLPDLTLPQKEKRKKEKKRRSDVSQSPRSSTINHQKWTKEKKIYRLILRILEGEKTGVSFCMIKTVDGKNWTT